jgi:ketosteroid isomerase-like protein
MKLKVFIFILLLSSISVFAQSKDEKDLKSLVKQMTDAQMNYQPEKLDKILTADYIEISPVGEFDPREKVLGFYKLEMKPPPDKMSATVEADEFSIRNYGNFAIVITSLNYKMTSEGKPLPPRSIRATFVLRKEKGAWKIASAQYTGIRTPQTNKPQ